MRDATVCLGKVQLARYQSMWARHFGQSARALLLQSSEFRFSEFRVQAESKRGEGYRMIAYGRVRALELWANFEAAGISSVD